MFDYLQKFKTLPTEIKAKVSSPEAMALLTQLETDYQVDLAMIIMRVMIKSLAASDLESVLISELGLGAEKAQRLATDLKTKFFSRVADYVGLSPKKGDPTDNIEAVIKEAGLSLASTELVERLRRLLLTYIKGVRRKIDTREALAKSIDKGGLELSAEEIDRVFKVSDRYQYHQQKQTQSTQSPSLKPELRIEPGYDLKQALASGETKKISSPTLTPLTAPVETEASKEGLKPEAVAIEEELSALEAQLTEEELVPAKTESSTPIKEPELVKPEPSMGEESAQTKKAVRPPEQTITPPEKRGLFRGFFAGSDKATKGSIQFAQELGSQAVSPAPVKEEKKTEVATKPSRENIVKAEPVAPAPKRMSPAPRPGDSRRQKIQDVKPSPKVMGPIEELLYLDIINFRRLGKTPAERTTKIFQKIKLLEKSGYGKMIEAIGAWKKSPVNRLYLANVQRAMAKGKTVKEAISEGESETNLSLAEIEAIIDLNSRLTF